MLNDGALGTAIEYDFNSINWHRNECLVHSKFYQPSGLNSNFKATPPPFLFRPRYFSRTHTFIFHSAIKICCAQTLLMFVFSFRKIMAFSQFDAIHSSTTSLTQALSICWSSCMFLRFFDCCCEYTRIVNVYTQCFIAMNPVSILRCYGFYRCC